MPLEELIGIPQAIDELGRLDIPDVGIPCDCNTGGVGWPSCRTPVLLLFSRQLLLAMSLLRVGGREAIKF